MTANTFDLKCKLISDNTGSFNRVPVYCQDVEFLEWLAKAANAYSKAESVIHGTRRLADEIEEIIK